MSGKERVKSILDRICNPADRGSCIEELKSVLDMEVSQLQKAEVSWCGGGQLEACLRDGVQALQGALQSIEEGDIDSGISSLAKYEELPQ